MGGKRKRGGKGGGGKSGGRGGKEASHGRGEGEPQDEFIDASDGENEGKGSRQAKGDVWREEPGNWEMSNPSYEAYYQRQCICPREEWPRLMESLRTGLPVAIRVNRMRAGACGFCTRLEELQRLCRDDTERECYAPQPLAWYPHGLGWQWPGLERRVIKKDRRHVQLKEYLAQRERSGLISRQEVVSMLPPMFLGVEPHHLVLDLCAAPGSKTSQMLEMMHWVQAAGPGGRPPSGLVLANELQWRRANMLSHQVQRVGSPCIAVVNMDAQYFPELLSPSSENGVQRPFRFDRVLCDVPCSGDGTMRKTPYIWKSWTWRDGLALHIRQLNILNRGLDLLKVGGRLVYSTCSLNPMEDEAVVAAALRRHGSAIAVVPPLPAAQEHLKAGCGLGRWAVPHPREEGVFFESYADIPAELKQGKLKLLPSMFPPCATDADDLCTAIREGCRRFLPHLMDTGGFFIATFEKRAELPPSAKARRLARSEALREGQGAAARKAGEAEAGVKQAEVEMESEQASAEAVAEAEAEPVEVVVEEAEAEAEEAEAEQADVEAQAGTQKPGVTGQDGRQAEMPTPSGPLHRKDLVRRITKEYISVEQALGVAEWRAIAEFYGLDRELSDRFVVRAGGDKGIFFLSEGARSLLLTETRLPTRVVICGVLALQRAQSHHVRACEWQLAQEGLASLCALGLRRRILLKRPLFHRLLTERDLPLGELQAAVGSGAAFGLEAVTEPAGSGLLPGSVAVVLHRDAAGAAAAGLPVVVAASIGEEALEVAVGSAEMAALLEDLGDQPSLDSILGASEAPAGEPEAKRARHAKDAGGGAGVEAPPLEAVAAA